MVYDVVTIGDSTKDIFIRPSEAHTIRDGFKSNSICFNHGAKIVVDESYQDIGGSACNVSVGLSKLGLKTALMSLIGQDDMAEEIRAKLSAENVDFKYLKKSAKFSTSFSVIIVYNSDRTVFIYRGKKDYSLLKIPKTLKTKWIYLGPVANSFESNYKDLIRLASEKNVRIAINPGSRQITEGREALKRLLRVSDILILNRQEAEDMAKIGRFSVPKDLLKRIKTLGPEIVVITDGAKGAYATDGEVYLGIKTTDFKAFDPTGAGDAFFSAFLATYINDSNLEIALKYGIINSSEVIKSYGAQTDLCDSTRIEKLLSTSPAVYPV